MIQELFRIKRTEDYYGGCWKMKKEIMVKFLEKMDIKMKKKNTHTHHSLTLQVILKSISVFKV